MNVKFVNIFACLLFVPWGLLGCGDAQDGVSDAKSDSDDIGNSSDGAGSGVVDDSLPCLGAISGRVLKNGTEGMKALVVVCMGYGTCHQPQATADDGTIDWRYPDLEEKETCVHHDFAGDEWLHIEIIAVDHREDYASYSLRDHPLEC